MQMQEAHELGDTLNERAGDLHVSVAHEENKGSDNLVSIAL